MFLLFVFLLFVLPSAAQNVTDLWLRGYSVIPTPRSVQLAPGEVVVDGNWVVDAGKVGRQNIAFRTLVKDVADFHSVSLRPGSGPEKVIRLAVAPGAVATETDAEIDRQAYRLRIDDNSVEITGNADAGLFYGVQTLVQLLKRDEVGRLLLPKGAIEDWPKLQLRFLHWDTKHHQDRMETLKRYLDWAARFKVNMIGFELEDKFEYPSHPVIGAPGAFTTAQLQELVDYGLERYIQIVPNVQAPAHMAYVLKHQEFADLRADGNNYQSCLCDPRTYDLIFSMYDDVINATKGVNYFYVSTDEVYYAGICAKCTMPYNEENRSLQWVEFVRRAHEHLSKRGRRMLIWVEYPLLAKHVEMIPPDIIDGVIGEADYIPIENKLGMRQLAYVSMQGGEHLFPGHLSLERESGVSRGRIESAFETISFGRVWKANPIGTFGAAWDDSGLHNETFWLGWSAVAQYGWNPGTAPVSQHIAEFMNVYYGPRTEGMIEIYRSMQRQAHSWQRTWDRVTSRVRGPGYGNSYGKGTGTRRTDMTLSPPPLPEMPFLDFKPFIADQYKDFLQAARSRMLENDQLILGLQANLGRVTRNHYNLEVFLALARFMGHHWRLLDALADAEKSLEEARAAGLKNEHAEAVGHLVAAYNAIGRTREEGVKIFADLRKAYEKSRYPKGRSVDGKKFFHVLDDTKDHWADRTADLSFMFVPEESIGLEKWQKDLRQVLEAYAKQHDVPVRRLAEARLEE
jgi:hexosaminidase